LQASKIVAVKERKKKASNRNEIPIQTQAQSTPLAPKPHPPAQSPANLVNGPPRLPIMCLDPPRKRPTRKELHASLYEKSWDPFRKLTIEASIKIARGSSSNSTSP
jgi:hypothetical protein